MYILGYELPFKRMQSRGDGDDCYWEVENQKVHLWLFVDQLHRFTPTKPPPPDSHLPLGHAAFFVVNSEAYGAGTTLAIFGHAGNSTEFHLPRTVPFRLLRKVGETSGKMVCYVLLIMIWRRYLWKIKIVIQKTSLHDSEVEQIRR